MSVPKLLTVDDVAAATPAPRSTGLYWLYTLRLASIKVGCKRLVTEAALLCFVGLAASDTEARA